MKTLLTLALLAMLSISALAQDAKPYEILVRLNPDGSVKGAHQTKLITYTLPDGSTINKETDPEPIKIEDLPKALSPALSQLSQALADRDAAISAKTDADKKVTDLQAAQTALIQRAEPALNQNDIGTLYQIVIEAKMPEVEKQKAALNAQIKALQDQKTQLESGK